MKQTQQDDAILTARARDAAALCQKRGCASFTPFLDERQQQLFLDALRGHPEVSCCFFGGYDRAQRMMAAVYEDFPPEEWEYPFVAATITYRGQDVLTHRDFLGTLMAMGIRRECVGDILVSPGMTVVFLTKEVAPFVLSGLDKVGGTGVQAAEGLPEELPAGLGVREISGTVASPRADALLAALCRVGREEACRLIRTGLAAVNHRLIPAPSTMLKEGDRLSVRGYGRFEITSVGPETKKGRLRFSAVHYQ